ncbi:MAG: hypothetical protein DI548_07980 [Flavobacterium johnsoniae]|nr:MAG: hypothetical protein DI548_07980 [Flavobacterium johnsoniae]
MFIMNYKNGRSYNLSLSLPYKVHGHALIEYDDEIYVFGGRGDYKTFYKNMYKLNRFMTWQKMANLIVKRYGITNSSVVLNGFIWAIGGRDGPKDLKSVEKYDPATNTWTKMPLVLF